MPCGGLWENVTRQFINCARVYAFGRRQREGLMEQFWSFGGILLLFDLRGANLDRWSFETSGFGQLLDS